MSPAPAAHQPRAPGLAPVHIAVLLCVLALVGISCSVDTAGVASVAPEASAPALAAGDASETVDPDPENPPVDRAAPGEPGEQATAVPAPAAGSSRNDDLLSGAFDPFREARGFRVTQTQAQINSVPSLGIDIRQTLDPTRPAVVTELAANGDTFTVVDLVATFGLTPGNPGDMFGLRIWSVEDRVVTDTTDYQILIDQDPSLDLGVFRPGIFSIDRSRVETVGSDRVIAALIGTSPPNPGELGERLPGALREIRSDPDDPSHLVGSTTFSLLTAALGADGELNARGLAGGMALVADIDVDELTETFITFYDSLDIEVDLWLNDDGSLRALGYQAEMSGIYQSLGGLDDSPETLSLFADAELTLDVLMTFEIDNTIVVTPPTGVTEDRTDEAIQFAIDSGF